MPLSMGVNWSKAAEVGLSLFLSPILGFLCAGLLLLALMKLVRSPVINQAPTGHTPPPWPLRLALIVSGLGVSVAHGSNDGQKGVGLVMLILIGILPGAYALNLDADARAISQVTYAAGQLTDYFNAHRREIDKGLADGDLYRRPDTTASPVDCDITQAVDAAQALQLRLAGLGSLAELPEETRWETRTNILCLDDAAEDMQLLPGATLADIRRLEGLRDDLRGPTEYAPDWVLLAVSLSLGVGTMVGWKRIVVTIGERIGKTRLTYGQGCAAQVVAMGAIGLADFAGLPVSTTHVLSSGVAGTMAAGKSGLQMRTLRSIAMAWVLTMPAAMVLGAGLFFLFAALG
jgi:phosphate/sulfate permease